ncbi:hypothetical protein H2202_008168 [Exophiala xenobiotica]|nr:hypothetical protein H2202_008168 [Exophiala xenobiotica]KAK5227277.1 hypothetical protein LTR72_003267 [Exophiala xenobiotica]KAK5232271.1 hypothetical protein LTR47_006800 [Exophiala xenobiotica]KAK5241842.1 hypothetical protein LTS06_011891 [Exophiala xenobiotica]KAK5279985.1 hypothetical protein LTR40_007017 [Exophiala xenobiotica]
MTSPSSYIPLTFVASTVFYSCLYALTGPLFSSSRNSKVASPALRLAARREAAQSGHCVLTTILVIICLRQELLEIYPLGVEVARHGGGPRRLKDSQLPIITHTSAFANALTTLELAWLLADTCILLYTQSACRPTATSVSSSSLASSSSRSYPPTQRRKSSPSQSTTSTTKTPLNYPHLYIHHAILISLLLWLQYTLLFNPHRGVGILIIVSFLLMNASSPLGSLRWFLLNFTAAKGSSAKAQQTSRSERDRHAVIALRAATCAYLLVFAICRIGLFYMIMKIWADMKGENVFRTWWELRWQCNVGFTAMVIINTLWWINGTVKFLRREIRGVGKWKHS